MIYYYKVFGMNVESDFPVDELIACSEVPESVDVYLRIGEVPDKIDSMSEKYDWYQINRDELLFSVDNVATYYVHHANEIIVKPCNGINPEVYMYLLGSCMGAILFQKGKIPFHGSAINIHGKGVIVSGDSGAGKSTLAAALIRKGYPMLTDDVAAISHTNDNRFIVLPGFPRQKLWEDSAEALAHPIGNVIRIEGDRKKYTTSSKSFCNEATPLAAIFELYCSNCDQVYTKQVHGEEKLEVLIRNTYRSMWLKHFGLMKSHFIQCVQMSKSIQVYQIFRPLNGFTTDAQIEAIENIICMGDKLCVS